MSLFSKIEPALKLLYGQEFVLTAAASFQILDDSDRLFIVGSTLLVSTASVHPDQSSVAHRCTGLSKSWPSFSPALLDEIASAGFYVASPSLLRCFHCSLGITVGPAGPAATDDDSFLQRHRLDSPACYFARQAVFVLRPLDLLDVSWDVNKFTRALKKLRRDLRDSTTALEVVEQFGYSKRAGEFAATRQFMRSNGRVPKKAGDMIKCLQELEDEYQESLMSSMLIESTDISGVLQDMKILADQQPSSAQLNLEEAVLAMLAASGQQDLSAQKP